MFLLVLLVFAVTPLFGSEIKHTGNTCSKEQWKCRDGTCISLNHKCDGNVNCPDGSDETHALCWNNRCRGDQFRCSYGGCVDITSPCNGLPACSDFSDELLPKCRNETREVGSEFKCHDGSLIPITNRCDGVKHCADGSDEMLWTCAGMACPAYLFQCAYGACVDMGAECNKLNACRHCVYLRTGTQSRIRVVTTKTTQVKDCADGSDEAVELCENIQTPIPQTITGKEQWKCRDGTCISLNHKCDGNVNCPDGSDETHALCWNNRCRGNQFRCSYGGCVDITSPCNGLPACSDFSDELLPKCRNETREVGSEFKCHDGSLIPITNRCDGVKHCADGSDEMLWTCAGMACPAYLFQCAYGACVDMGAECNKVKDCADGSDEAVELCENIQTPIPQTITGTPSFNGHRSFVMPAFGSQNEKCVLPPYPTDGTYKTNRPNAKPGDAFDFLAINVTCRDGFGLDGPGTLYCINGSWPQKIPKCVLQCLLLPDPSLEYNCYVSGNIEGRRPCKEKEITGTVVQPRCRNPNYYSSSALPKMQCLNGNWSYQPKCKQECGTITTTHYLILGAGGGIATLGEVPWQVGIYDKRSRPYRQICGGSLINTNIVISAAHCFWSNLEGKQIPADNYAAAVGKRYRPWKSSLEAAQLSDVKEVHLPVRFQGSAANFQEDIAVVIVTTPFQYSAVVKPVCVDFDFAFDMRQLDTGHYGKVAGWGLTNVTSLRASPILTVLELPYVDTRTCITESPPLFRAHITSDKFCAGYKGGFKAVCQGDSGGGLAFPEVDRGQKRYYLRGVVSTAPEPDEQNTCNADTYTAFTQLVKHEHFIKQFWDPNSF